MPSGRSDPRGAFIEAAVWHGTLDAAESILSEHPEIARGDIFTAAILGDDARVRQLLQEEPRSATRKSGPYDVEPLVYLCLSKYLRLDQSRSPSFMHAATALLDAGADPNAGFWNKGEWETALYGACGVAHHADLTRLLLERGAVPDGEVCYHAAEGHNNEAMHVLVRSGKLSEDNLTTLLVRKIDWHDEEGVRWLLENGAAANALSLWGFPALPHALRRDNALAIIDMLLDRGADPLAVTGGRTAVALAARGGRSDVLESLERRGVSTAFEGVDRLIAACAMGDSTRVRAITTEDPGLVSELQAEGGTLLAAFTVTGNLPGVRQLLDLSVPVTAVFEEGDGYFGVAPGSMALHVAAWLARHDILGLLIECGSPVDAKDGKGRTALQLAVKACVDSYWTERRSPESVKALLNAGASVEGVTLPSGYDEVDDLLKARSA